MRNYYYKNTYLNALFGTALVIVKRMDITSLFQAIAEGAAGLADFAHAFIYLVDPTDEYLELKAGSNGINNKYVGMVLRRGEGLSGKVLEEGHSIIIDSYDTWPGKILGLDFDGLGAMMSVPIYSNSRIVAVLGLAYSSDSNKSLQ